MHKNILTVAVLLSYLLLSTPTQFFANDIPDYNCITTACKKYNQWDGGTTGGWQVINLPAQSPSCYTGCNWIQQGMWAKYNATGTYIFAGLEKTQSTYKYMYIEYIPASGQGPRYRYIADKPASDNYAYLVIYRDTNYQRVLVQSYYNGYLSVVFQENTNATEALWDVLHTGTRISSISSGANIPTYTTDDHQWRCGSCGNIWLYQTSDGYFASQGSANNMYNQWLVYPHQSGSYGGTYEASCAPSYCP